MHFKYSYFAMILFVVSCSISNENQKVAQSNAEHYIKDSLEVENYEFISMTELKETTKSEVVAGIEFSESKLKYPKTSLELELEKQKRNIKEFGEDGKLINEPALKFDIESVLEYEKNLNRYNFLLQSEHEIYEFHAILSYYGRNESGNTNKYSAWITFNKDLTIYDLSIQ